MKQDIPSAADLQSFLQEIYPCKAPFELLVIDKKLKTKVGVYRYDKKGVKTGRIRIYSKGLNATLMEEVAIHEYAHHIQHTEKGGIFGRQSNKVHGEYFWRIYSALRAKATRKGLHNDNLIKEIVAE